MLNSCQRFVKEWKKPAGGASVDKTRHGARWNSRRGGEGSERSAYSCRVALPSHGDDVSGLGHLVVHLQGKDKQFQMVSPHTGVLR